MAGSMSVAVACESEAGLQGGVCQHFGHTPFFAVVTVADGKVGQAKLVASPGHGEGCSMPSFVATLGVQAVIVGGIGGGAVNRLQSLGIKVHGGATGSAGHALESFAAGALAEGSTGCSGHEGQGCSGHHHEHG